MSFETKSFKPKIKKVKKLFRLLGESLIYSFFNFKSHQQCKKSVQKEKRDLKRKRLGHQMIHGKAIENPGGLNPQLHGSTF